MRSLFAGALALSASAGAMQTLLDISESSRAVAQEVEQGVISRVIVLGNQRVEARTVQSYLLVEPGDSFDPERIDLSLKTLFATQLFADVLIERDGSNLVVRVSENPIINQVIFEGNSAIREDKLTEETEAAPREIFTQARVQQDVQRILELYRRAGRFAASVKPTYKPLAQNRVDLIFEISEGPKTGVRSINFIGNERYNDAKLRSEVVTRQSKWWNFFESNDNYDPDRLEYDREVLRQFYTNEGYADFRVTSAIAELTPDQEDFFITFTIDEGVQYNFGELKVETALEKLSSDGLQRILPLLSGELYRADAIEDAIDAITFAAGTAGYASVDVRPRVERNPEDRTIDITFLVDEGPRVYIERLDVVGNTQTLDHVIRREMRVSEGDAFNRILLDQSRNDLRALGFFKDVTITEEPGSAPDKTRVKVQVEEQPTGELAFSAGFSSADAFLFSVSASQRNFRGRGQAVSARIQTTSRQQDYSFQFTEPKFQGRNLAAGVDLFATQSDFFDIAGFENSSLGGGLRLGFPLGDRTQLGLRYNLRRDDVSVFSPETTCRDDGTTFPSPICDQLGERVTSALGYSLVRDRRNDPISPTRGYRVNWSQDVAGLGGDVKYLRNEVRGSVYRGVAPGFTLSGSVSAGLIEGWDDDFVRINNRFFKGGNSFRGFDVAGLGPRIVSYTNELSNLTFTDPADVPGGDLSRPYYAQPIYTRDENNAITGISGYVGSFNPENEFDDAPETDLALSQAVLLGDGSFSPAEAGGATTHQVVQTDENGEPITNIIKGNAQGGKLYAIGTVELTVPLPFAPEELGLDAAIFTEFGTLGLLDDRDTARLTESFGTRTLIEDDLSLRASAGVSIFWDSPFGPIRFDFSQVLNREEYDRTETFRFSTSTQF